MGNLTKISINNSEHNFKDSSAREQLSRKADKSGSSSINFDVKNLYVYGTQSSGNIYPLVSSATIGSSDKYWQNIYTSNIYIGDVLFKENSGLSIEYGENVNLKILSNSISLNNTNKFINVYDSEIDFGNNDTKNIIVNSDYIKLYHDNLININDILKIKSDGIYFYDKTNLENEIISIKNNEFLYKEEKIATQEYLTENFALLTSNTQDILADEIDVNYSEIEEFVTNSIQFNYGNVYINGLSNSGFLKYNPSLGSFGIDTNTYVNTETPILNGTITMTDNISLPSSIGTGLITYDIDKNEIDSISESTFVKVSSPVFETEVTIPNKLKITNVYNSGVLYYDNSSTEISVISTDNWATADSPTFTGTITLPTSVNFTDLSSGMLYYNNTDKVLSVISRDTYAPADSPTFTGTVTIPNANIIKDSAGNQLSSGFLRYNKDNSVLYTDSTSYAPADSPTFTGTVTMPSTVTISDLSGSGNLIYSNGTLSLDTFDTDSYIRYIDIPLFDYIYNSQVTVTPSSSTGVQSGSNFNATSNGSNGSIQVELFRNADGKSIINKNTYVTSPTSFFTKVNFFYKINISGTYRISLVLKPYYDSTYSYTYKFSVSAGVHKSKPSVGTVLSYDVSTFTLNSSNYHDAQYIYSQPLEITVSSSATRYIVINIGGGYIGDTSYNFYGMQLFDMHIFLVS